MSALLTFLRDGGFLTRERIRLWSILFLAGFAAAIAYLFITAHGLNDYMGRPLGSDFSNVYAAGVAALHGNAAAPFDILKQQKQEQAIFGPTTPLYGWHYPPFFLLVAAPLAKLPYIPALIVWQLATLALYLVALGALWKRSASPEMASDKSWILAALGFTAVFVNLTHGHNGFLTTALFAGALALLDARPLIAGLLFGLLAYKPQFAVTIPLVLAATGRWRAFTAAAATVLLLAILVTALFGAEVWPAFTKSLPFTREVVLEQGSTGFQKIQSVFAAVRLWGGPIGLAYAAQAVAIVLVAVVLVRLWRSDLSFGYKGAGLCLAALLCTPYSLDYDLMLLAPTILLLAAEAKRHGFQPYEAASLALLWLAPVATRGVAQVSLIPLGLIAMLWVFHGLSRRVAARRNPALHG